MFSTVMEFIPIKPFLLWLPQIMRLAEIELKKEVPVIYQCMFKIM